MGGECAGDVPVLSLALVCGSGRDDRSIGVAVLLGLSGSAMWAAFCNIVEREYLIYPFYWILFDFIVGMVGGVLLQQCAPMRKTYHGVSLRLSTYHPVPKAVYVPTKK